MNSTPKDVNGFLPGREDAAKTLATALQARAVPAELVSTKTHWPQRSWVYGVQVDGTAVVRAKYCKGVWRYRLQPPGLAPSDDLPPSARDFGDATDPDTAADAVQAWLTEQDERPVYIAIDEPVEGEPPEPGQA